jgi:hypothetical protein
MTQQPWVPTQRRQRATSRRVAAAPRPPVSATTTVVAVALALAIAVATVVRYWSLPTGISLLLRHGGPMELLFELVLPMLVPVLLLIAAFLMVARIRAGRMLAIVGAGLVLIAPVAVTAVVGQWPNPGTTANTVLLYLPMVLAVALVVLAAIPVTGIYLRSKDLST